MGARLARVFIISLALEIEKRLSRHFFRNRQSHDLEHRRSDITQGALNTLLELEFL